MFKKDTAHTFGGKYINFVWVGRLKHTTFEGERNHYTIWAKKKPLSEYDNQLRGFPTEGVTSFYIAKYQVAMER